jgi:endogenous inhibitor of DNA gyrase (YacG/DUF329 family)
LTAAARQKRCPICNRPASDEHRPFCSRRCADVDLHRWLSGRYAIPAVEEQPGSRDNDDESRDERN